MISGDHAHFGAKINGMTKKINASCTEPVDLEEYTHFI